MERGLSGLLGHAVRVHGSGRTDSGVHALCQVAHFDSRTPLPARIIERALPGRLPDDIATLYLESVGSEFDARRDAIARSYRYRIVLSRNPLLRLQAWEVRQPLDFPAMEKAADHLTGAIDGTSFAASTRKGEDNRIDVKSAGWSRHGDEVWFEITANRFVHRFVRNVVGTMIDIGRGKMEAAEIPRILAAVDRKQAGPAAPAHGLYLMNVYYETGPSAPQISEGGSDEVLSRYRRA